MDKFTALGFFCFLAISSVIFNFVFIKTLPVRREPYPKPNNANALSNGQKGMNTSAKLILVFTDLFSQREWYHLPEKEAKHYTKTVGCRVDNCEITYDRSLSSNADAVLFRSRNMPATEYLREYSKSSRPSHQRWVYFTSETPLNNPDRVPLNGLFNWTMSYKKESDIWLPYQRYERRVPSEPRLEIMDYAAKKRKEKDRKLAMWISSNCGRLRDQLVTKLQDFISIDVGGRCGPNFKSSFAFCTDVSDDCFEIAKKYKFYLALESGFCEQYVTEKYWNDALAHDTIPIVFGAGPYDDPNVAIPGSFINVQDFDSVKALSDYLNYLDKNDTAYNEYFAWKQTYKLTKTVGWPFPDIWACEICEKLHYDDNIKVYDRLSDFWSDEDCKGKDKKALKMLSRQ